MDQRDEKARSIFLNALEIAAEQRGSYLDTQCGDNRQLRAEVDDLLRHHQEMGSFLDSPAIAEQVTEPLPSPDPALGEMVGPYKLLQKLGEGGMGVVFMAEQSTPVRRRVALKIIKPGMDSKQVIARFEAERQALAMMDHPNIAKVLGAGTTPSSHPYFVMELVKGVPITTYCNEQQLTPRQRLELFVSVCHAVQHAHQKGVIHRDLKPTNVLIAHYDNKPVVKVIDFGLAKATGQQLTEKTLVTYVGQVAGTLEYMSPEQARFNQLDVDTRTDIYSLGVILYELLTGVTPFDRERLRCAALDEIVRIIRDEEPPKPSTRVSNASGKPSTAAADCRTEPGKFLALLRGDLDWLVMKALDKERERRYETANSFAADIERYLDGDPIEARPPTTLYRLRKTVSRHRVAIGAAGSVVIALAVGLVACTLLYRDAVRARDRAVVAKQQAQENLDRLKDEIFERALNEALLGGPNADNAVRRAEEVGIPDAKLNVLRGLQAFYRGDYDLAKTLLEDAERTVASRAVLAWVSSVAGDHRSFARVAAELDELEVSSATDSLLFAHLHSVVIPEIGLAYSERGLEELDSSILGHAIHAIAYANTCLDDLNLDGARQAIGEINACRTFKPNNVFVLSTSLQVYCVAHQIAALKGMTEDAATLLLDAEGIGVKLDEAGGRYTAWDRAYFLSLADRPDEAIAAWCESIQPNTTGFTAMVMAPFSRLHNRETEVLQILDKLQDQDGGFTKLAVAMLRADDPGFGDTAREIFDQIANDYGTCDPHLFALQLLLMTGQADYAEDKAAELLGRSKELILPYKSHIRYLARQCSDSELLDKSPRLGHFDIALKAFVADDLEKATRHFKECEKGTHFCAQYWWAKVYLAKINAMGSGETQ